MSNMNNVFGHGKAFIPFVTAGDCGLEFTEKLLFACEEGGADLVEIGIPFSDPTAEGPVVQEASGRALKLGTTPGKIIDMVKKSRADGLKVPLAFMTYANPVFNYGTEKFAKKCVECDVCAVIIPEIPFEEKHEMSDIFDKYNVNMISLAAPASHERTAMIASEAEGFIYCAGVNGMKKDTAENLIKDMVASVKKAKNIPCAVEFDISVPEQAESIAHIADGIISANAVVNIVSEYRQDSIPYVRDYVKSVKNAVQSNC